MVLPFQSEVLRRLIFASQAVMCSIRIYCLLTVLLTALLSTGQDMEIAAK